MVLVGGAALLLTVAVCGAALPQITMRGTVNLGELRYATPYAGGGSGEGSPALRGGVALRCPPRWAWERSGRRPRSGRQLGSDLSCWHVYSSDKSLLFHWFSFVDQSNIS